MSWDYCSPKKLQLIWNSENPQMVYISMEIPCRSGLHAPPFYVPVFASKSHYLANTLHITDSLIYVYKKETWTVIDLCIGALWIFKKYLCMSYTCLQNGEFIWIGLVSQQVWIELPTYIATSESS